MVMHGKLELRTTREHWNARHKSRESIIRAKEDVLGGPRIVATDKARCLGGGGGGCLLSVAAERS